MYQQSREITLRAIEWMNFPAFSSQLWAPLAFAVVPWWMVVMVVVCGGLLWTQIRYRFVHLGMLNLMAVLVTLLRWPAAALGAYFSYKNHMPVPVVAGALFWFIFAVILCIPGQIGRVEGLIAEAFLNSNFKKCSDDDKYS